MSTVFCNSTYSIAILATYFVVPLLSYNQCYATRNSLLMFMGILFQSGSTSESCSLPNFISMHKVLEIYQPSYTRTESVNVSVLTN